MRPCINYLPINIPNSSAPVRITFQPAYGASSTGMHLMAMWHMPYHVRLYMYPYITCDIFTLNSLRTCYSNESVKVIRTIQCVRRVELLCPTSITAVRACVRACVCASVCVCVCVRMDPSVSSAAAGG